MWTETTTTYVNKKNLVIANKKTLDGKLLKGKRKAKVITTPKIIVVMPLASLDEIGSELPELLLMNDIFIKVVKEEDFKSMFKDLQ